MIFSFKSPLAAAAVALMATTVAFADDPRPVDKAVAESKDSGALDRAHPEMKAVLQKLMDLGAKPVHTLTVEQARTQPTPADAVRAVVAEKTGAPPMSEPVGKTEEVLLDGAAGKLTGRVYWPADVTAGTTLPLIVYFHGGGWVIATIDTYDASARALSNQAKAVVVSVEYRKGPEARFPAAHNDAVAAYKYAIENSGKWNADADKTAVAGESAGGNMAIDVAIAARDEKLTSPKAVLAVYPVAGADLNAKSYIANQNAMPLGKADIQWFLDKYLTSMDEAKDSRLDIVGAAELSGLPPVTIVAAEIDPLNSEGMTLRDRLKAAGNDVAYQNWNGVTHEFFGMAAVVPEAKAAQNFAGERLRTALGE